MRALLWPIAKDYVTVFVFPWVKFSVCSAGETKEGKADKGKNTYRHSMSALIILGYAKAGKTHYKHVSLWINIENIHVEKSALLLSIGLCVDQGKIQ